jgi:hypothetical protein
MCEPVVIIVLMPWQSLQRPPLTLWHTTVILVLPTLFVYAILTVRGYPTLRRQSRRSGGKPAVLKVLNAASGLANSSLHE